MALTGAGYVAAFAAMVVSIQKRNITGIRAVIIADFIISIPARTVIGFAIALIGFGLTFAPSVGAYFGYREP